MFDFDYPRVRQSLGQAALQDPYPAWLLDSQGAIYAANLMAFWLWEMLVPGEPIRPDTLLSTSHFSLLAGHFRRIPPDQNREFYSKRAAVVKRLDANQGLPLYAPFITAMKADPQLAYILEHAMPHPDREWEYPIRITPPRHEVADPASMHLADQASVGDQENPGDWEVGLFGGTRREETGLLEFQVTNYRIEGEAGILVVYSPRSGSLPSFERQYSQLVEMYGDRVYIQPDNERQEHEESDQHPVWISSSRTYYPMIIQDSLWYLTGENRAQRLLLGMSVVGTHFFELFLAPQLREWMGPLHETSAPRAVKYFDMFTSRFLREDHDLHEAYQEVVQRLLRLPGFRDLFDVARKLPIHITLPEHTEIPFYTCRVLLPWTFSPGLMLQFRSMVRFLYTGQPDHLMKHHYEETLVPENYETEIALILSQLAATTLADSEMGADEPEHGFLRQLLWILAIVRTAQEGLTMLDEENAEASHWEPEVAFGRIYGELVATYADATESTRDKLLARLRTTIEAIGAKGMIDKKTILAMLRSFISARADMDRLGQFLDGWHYFPPWGEDIPERYG